VQHARGDLVGGCVNLAGTVALSDPELRVPQILQKVVTDAECLEGIPPPPRVTRCSDLERAHFGPAHRRHLRCEPQVTNTTGRTRCRRPVVDRRQRQPGPYS
jgi:hypothetical protein